MKNKKQDIAEKTAQIFLDIGAVSFRFNPPYTFTSGLRSPIYLDNRIVPSYPRERNKIIQTYLEIIKRNVGLDNVDYISATASAAIPQGSLIADKLNLPLVFVRPTTKTYGKGNKLEGYLKKGSKVIVIEDHISTGVSAVGNAQTIRELGGKVIYCIATTTFETPLSKKNLKENKIKLLYLTTGKIILNQAFKNKKLTLEEKKKVDSWFDDPPAWYQKYYK